MKFKVKCVSTGFTPHFTVGKIYDVDESGLSCNTSDNYTIWMHGDGKNNFTKLKEWFNDFDGNTRFELVDDQKIVITTDGKTTTATLYREDGSKEVATAKCCPEDTFDFNVGAKLSMERLMKKVAPVEEWRVVDREPRPGDYIRITNPEYSFDKKGDIRKIDGVHDYDFVYIYQKNHPTSESSKNPNFDWSYPKRMWELVEKVTATEPKKPEPPKYFTGKAICVRDCCPWWTKGKIYEFVNGTVRDEDGDMRTYQTEYHIKHKFNQLFIPIIE